MSSETIRIDSEAFARRLANMLREQRRTTGRSLNAMAQSSGGRFSRSDLRKIESGRITLGAADLQAIAELYEVDLDAIRPARVKLEVEPAGLLKTAGVATPFDPADEESLLISYLHLVRRLRGAEHSSEVELRRVDIEILAVVMDLPGEVVVDRLGALMGATRKQRGALIGTFAAGAAVIGLGSILALTANTGAASSAAADALVGPSASAPTTEVVAMPADLGEQGPDSDVELPQLPFADDDEGSLGAGLDPTPEPEADADSQLGPDVASDVDEAGADADAVETDADTDTTAAAPDSGAGSDTNTAATDDGGENAPETALGDNPESGPDAVSDESGSSDEMAETDATDTAMAEDEPMVEREPMMSPVPAPDPIVEREPVMSPVPMPDPIVGRGPVMMPMPAPVDMQPIDIEAEDLVDVGVDVGVDVEA